MLPRWGPAPESGCLCQSCLPSVLLIASSPSAVLRFRDAPVLYDSIPAPIQARLWPPCNRTSPSACGSPNRDRKAGAAPGPESPPDCPLHPIGQVETPDGRRVPFNAHSAAAVQFVEILLCAQAWFAHQVERLALDPRRLKRRQQSACHVIHQHQGSLLVPLPHIWQTESYHHIPMPAWNGLAPRPTTMPGRKITTGRPCTRCIRIKIFSDAALARH